MLTFGLNLAVLSVFAMFRIRHGNEFGRHEQGEYSLTMFLEHAVPKLLLDLMRPPD